MHQELVGVGDGKITPNGFQDQPVALKFRIQKFAEQQQIVLGLPLVESKGNRHGDCRVPGWATFTADDFVVIRARDPDLGTEIIDLKVG